MKRSIVSVSFSDRLRKASRAVANLFPAKPYIIITFNNDGVPVFATNLKNKDKMPEILTEIASFFKKPE